MLSVEEFCNLPFVVTPYTKDLHLTYSSMLNRSFSQRAFLALLLLCGLMLIPSSHGLTIITNCTGLQAMNNNLAGNYQLGNDIDCTATVTWNAGAGFTPIGSYAVPFTGTFQGQNHIIYNITIKLPTTQCVGLFGHVSGASVLISQVGLRGVTVSGGYQVGGLTGWNVQGLVSNSYVTGNISVASGSGDGGGLVGENGGTISNSYSTASVGAGGAIFGVGGLVGGNGGTISNSYSIGQVSGLNVGGLIQDNVGTVISAYWNIQTSMQSASSGGAGLTIQWMQQSTTFVGWDFSATWVMNSGHTYPLLQGFVVPPTMSSALGNVTQYIGNSLQFSIPANTFVDSNGLQLSYSVLLANQQPLPAWLVFQASTQTFVGTPLSGAQAMLSIVVTVCNVPSKCVQGVFSLTVPDRAPVVQTAIPTQQALNGQSFEYILPVNIFFDTDGDSLSLSATAVNGYVWPTWLSFNAPLGIFSGTSTLRGVYAINLTANDNYGSQVSTQFNIVTPNTAPKVVASFPNQVLTVGVTFSFALPSGSFVDIDADSMTYSATLFGGASLLPWLNFDANTVSFTGTPNAEGFLMVAVTATDTYNASTSLYFGITVLAATGNAPPVLVIRMQDQTVIVGKNIQLFLPTGMFIDPNGYTLIYSAMLSDGSALPSWLTFNTTELVFTGVPSTVTTVKITVAVVNGHGGSAQNTFNLMTQASQPPVLTNQLPNQQVAVGAQFSYTVPDNTFYDADGNALIYSASQLGNGALPSWLKFDASTRVFSGTPKPSDTNTYAAKTSTIQVCASDGEAKSCTNFVMSVTGQSPLAQAITVILSLASALSTLYGIYRNRAWIWNTFAQKKYRKPDQKINIGDTFSYQFTLAPENVHMVRVYTASGRNLPHGKILPDWMSLDQSKGILTGTPSKKESFWICAIGHDNRNLEAFMLHVIDPNGGDNIELV